MGKIKVNVNICGNDYVILSDEDESYVKTIASEVDEKISEALNSNIRKSVSKAAILVAMNYCDKCKKLRSEMDVYLNTVQQDQFDIQRLKEQISELTKQIETLKRNRYK